MSQSAHKLWVASYQRRFRFFLRLIIFVYLVLIVRLFQLQVQKGTHYQILSRANATKKEWVDAPRGNLYSRDGVALAKSISTFDVVVDPFRTKRETLEEVATLVDAGPREVNRVWERVEKQRKRKFAEKVSAGKTFFSDNASPAEVRDKAAIVAQELYRLPGIDVLESAVRTYPEGSTAGHVVGHTAGISPKEFEACRQVGCSPNKQIGRSGAEYYFDSFLQGRLGLLRYATDARMNRLPDEQARLFINKPLRIPPEPGQDVFLTIDFGLQKAIEKIVGERTVATVVVDVNTGDVLAMVSRPPVDPNVMVGGSTRTKQQKAAYRALLDDPNRPLIDKTVANHYPPGSTFKFVTALAALQDEAIKPSRRVFCTGATRIGKDTFSCNGVHGMVDLDVAIQRSCNVYFWETAKLVGMERIADVAESFGFNRPSTIGINRDISGNIPRRIDYKGRGGHNLGHTLNMATGQGDVLVTVMQMAMAYAALANGGDMLTPRLLAKRVGAYGVVKDYAKDGRLVRSKVAIAPRHIERLRTGMVWAVNRPQGTAFRRGRSDIVEIAGKTGTAEVRGKKAAARLGQGCSATYRKYCDHAWFAGFAPVTNPQIAVVVLVENGGSGGVVAAPIAKQIFEAYFSPPGEKP